MRAAVHSGEIDLRYLDKFFEESTQRKLFETMEPKVLAAMASAVSKAPCDAQSCVAKVKSEWPLLIPVGNLIGQVRMSLLGLSRLASWCWRHAVKSSLPLTRSPELVQSR